MLKKVSYTVVDKESRNMQHSLCNSDSTLFTCESGHVVCNGCRNSEKTQIRNINATEVQDLASGDYFGANHSASCRFNGGSVQYYDSTGTSKNKHIEVSSLPNIKYKDAYYKDSKSRIFNNPDFPKEYHNNGNSTISSRPIVCPVTECSKILTMDSIMLHFHFDHSKVLRIVLKSEPCEIYIQPQNITAQKQCLASFHLPHERSKECTTTKSRSNISRTNSNMDSKLLLLLAVKVQPYYSPNYNHDLALITKDTKHIQLQSNRSHGNDHQVEKSLCLSRSSSEYKSCISSLAINDNEVLLLWLCKLDEEEQTYSITLSKDDRKQGFCYIGDAVYIRDNQDPSWMFHKSQCLAVKGTALNNLLNNENQINLTINVIQ